MAVTLFLGPSAAVRVVGRARPVPVVELWRHFMTSPVRVELWVPGDDDGERMTRLTGVQAHPGPARVIRLITSETGAVIEGHPDILVFGPDGAEAIGALSQGMPLVGWDGVRTYVAECGEVEVDVLFTMSVRDRVPLWIGDCPAYPFERRRKT